MLLGAHPDRNQGQAAVHSETQPACTTGYQRTLFIQHLQSDPVASGGSPHVQQYGAAAH